MAAASTKEDLEKIFGVFVSHKGGRGTGLGLPVSQKILQEHGGRIRVESQLDHGSRFTLEFPATSPNTVAGEPIPNMHKSTSVQELSTDGSSVSGSVAST